MPSENDEKKGDDSVEATAVSSNITRREVVTGIGTVGGVSALGYPSRASTTGGKEIIITLTGDHEPSQIKTIPNEVYNWEYVKVWDAKEMLDKLAQDHPAIRQTAITYSEREIQGHQTSQLKVRYLSSEGKSGIPDAINGVPVQKEEFNELIPQSHTHTTDPEYCSNTETSGGDAYGGLRIWPENTDGWGTAGYPATQGYGLRYLANAGHVFDLGDSDCDPDVGLWGEMDTYTGLQRVGEVEISSNDLDFAAIDNDGTLDIQKGIMTVHDDGSSHHKGIHDWYTEQGLQDILNYDLSQTGSTTGETSGNLEEVGINDYGGTDCHAHNDSERFRVEENDDPLTGGGDSGGPWYRFYDGDNVELAGLHTHGAFEETTHDCYNIKTGSDETLTITRHAWGIPAYEIDREHSLYPIT